jgi:hypothetical protein
MRKFKTCQALIFPPQILAVSGEKAGAQGKFWDAGPGGPAVVWRLDRLLL